MSRKNKRSVNKSVKYAMISIAGTRCMYCDEDVGSKITWHHLKPRYAGGTDSLENASLLCEKCHRHIHKYQWGSVDYKRITKVILVKRDNYTARKWEFSFK